MTLSVGIAQQLLKSISTLFIKCCFIERFIFYCYVDCRYVMCRYAESRGATYSSPLMSF